MNSSYDTQRLVQELLRVAPELQSEYNKMLKEAKGAGKSWTREELDVMEQLREKHQLPKLDYTKPGPTLVFEQLLVPFLLDLIRDKQHVQQLTRIMNWVEQLASSEIFAIRNHVAVSICEPLITNHQSSLEQIVPFMGVNTKKLCIMQFEIYRVNDNTKKLFGV